MEATQHEINEQLFALRDFSFSYPKEENTALTHIDFSVERGEFLLLCGASGSGKSTLLRQLKPALAPYGEKSGEIYFCGNPLADLPSHTWDKIGFILQSPESQIVTDKVWHELAFGLESLGVQSQEIRRKVAEMATFFGIEDLYHRKTNSLSGGQKQLVSLASVLLMEPLVLILDEPTSQLDPIAAKEFLTILKRVNLELGTTVILSEHRLEDAVPLADRVLVMDGGCVSALGSPREVGLALKNASLPMMRAMPVAMQVWWSVGDTNNCPVSVVEARTWLEHWVARHEKNTVKSILNAGQLGGVALVIKELFFRYEKQSNDTIDGLSLDVFSGEFFALLGGNGAGKSTLLKLIYGLEKAQSGSVKCQGKLGYLPQNPQLLFVKKTVEEDLFDAVSGGNMSFEDKKALIIYTAKLCRLEGLFYRHPYDLSGGEQQRLGLCKVLLAQPNILLLDEPTKGMDAVFKAEFGEILNNLLAKGITIFMVSHDVEFAANYAHRCALLFHGDVVSQGSAREFFAGNRFYTTAANRMSRGILEDIVTTCDLIEAVGGDLDLAKKCEKSPQKEPCISREIEKQSLPLWRKILAAISGVFFLMLTYKAIHLQDLSALISGSGLQLQGENLFLTYALVLLSMALFAVAFSGFRGLKKDKISLKKRRQKQSGIAVISAICALLFVPLTLYIGVFCLQSPSYYLLSLLVICFAMAPFLILFEGRKPKAREIVLLASLCAIAVAGRAAFFMFPQCKPVLAITLIVGVSLGMESGFLVGAMSMLLSNMLFSQGPWTPFQMFAMGLVGFLSALLFRGRFLRPTKLALALWGLLSSVVIYGGIVNPSFVLFYSGEFNFSLLAAYYVTGFPMDLIQGIASFFFLWYGGIPLLEKLERVKEKYGLLE